MPIRHWLDWSTPCLPAAAVWLIDRHHERHSCDLQSLTCVLPGRRAGRLVLAALVGECGRRELSLVPPTILTPGPLVDSLLEADESPTATGCERTLGWMMAIGECDAQARRLLLGTRSGGDLFGDFELARTVDRLHEELAGELLSFREVPALAQGLEMFAEGDRWQALQSVAARYHAILGSCGLVDPHAHRREAIAAGRFSATGPIVLIGLTQLNRQQRAVILAAGDQVAALVHAPPSRSELFDELGCPKPQAWEEIRLSISDDQILVAEGPEDQTHRAMGQLAELKQSHGPDQITIGVGDPALIEPLERAAVWAGLSVHAAAGIAVHRTPPVRLLGALGSFLGGSLGVRRFGDLATLVRHPDLERWLARVRPAGPDVDIASLLDRYYAEHLHERLDGEWRGSAAKHAQPKALLETLQRLMAPLTGTPRPLGEWSAPLLGVLEEVYGDLETTDTRPSVQTTVGACLWLRDLLTMQRNASPRLQPTTDAATAIRLVLWQAAGETVALEPRTDEIELLGWLELHLDPAPILILTGCNDGRIPESLTADLFLPDSLRRALGLMDNARRYARDAYLMEAITQSRVRLRVIMGRSGVAGDPLLPSRLLLACDDETILRRLKRICRQPREGTRAFPIGAPACSAKARIGVPALGDGCAPPESMTVTDFRRYLECPYRYALQRLLGLEALADDAVELGAGQFGTLAHEALKTLGDPAIRDAVEPEAIQAWLDEALRTAARKRYGRNPMPAVRLQLASLGQRLAGLARLQARLRAGGWSIVSTELELAGETVLQIPGQEPMPVRGTIDRVDRHQETGDWRIIDYKTSERGRGPTEVHHGRTTLPPPGEAQWLDLQLPLYHHFAPRLGITGTVELAYIVLPKTSADILPARWTSGHLQAALQVARGVVRDIRAGRFDLNLSHRRMFDPFQRICQTLAFGADDDQAGADA